MCSLCHGLWAAMQCSCVDTRIKKQNVSLLLIQVIFAHISCTCQFGTISICDTFLYQTRVCMQCSHNQLCLSQCLLRSSNWQLLETRRSGSSWVKLSRLASSNKQRLTGGFSSVPKVLRLCQFNSPSKLTRQMKHEGLLALLQHCEAC